MALDLTQNPLYRRPYGQNNPLMPQQSWQLPPNEYFPRTNYAAQDVNNLLGNFFAQNYTPQYQPVTTQAYQTASARPSSEFDAQPLLAYANQAPPPTTGYQTNSKTSTPYYQPTPIRNDNPNAWQDLQNEAYTALQNQAVQAGLIGLASGGLYYGLGSIARPAIPYAFGVLGATRYGEPIVNKINQIANSPLGKIATKAFEKASSLFW